MNGIDISRFEFDFDTTWAAFFLDAELNIYSRYGGRDSDSAEGRLSIESLAATMNEVLDVHARRTGDARVDAALWQPVPQEKKTPESLPLLQQSHQGCVHCHQVKEYTLLQAFHDKRFERDLLFGFPLPENVGLQFDRQRGHALHSLAAGSPADRAGLKPGDVVTRVAGVPIRSEMDVRWALHRFDGAGPLPVELQRGAESSDPQTVEVAIELPVGWRQTDLSWRKSLRSVPLPLGFLGYALGREELAKAGLKEDRLAIRLVSIRGPGLAEAIGLAKGDVIVAQGKRSESRTLEQFKSDLLRDHPPGDRVVFKVIRDGTVRTLEGVVPDWRTTETTVP